MTLIHTIAPGEDTSRASTAIGIPGDPPSAGAYAADAVVADRPIRHTKPGFVGGHSNSPRQPLEVTR